MIRVLIAEDMNIVRAALAALLMQSPDICVVAELARGDEVVAAAVEHEVDVAVLDFDMPGLDGIAASEQLRDRCPNCATLILTSVARPGVMRRALAARVGGVLRKDAPPSELANAVRKVAAGQRVIDSELALSVWDLPQNPLTAREAEILALVADGMSVSEIAGRLFLSRGTVRNYLTTVVTKLQARNRLGAVRLARDADWI